MSTEAWWSLSSIPLMLLIGLANRWVYCHNEREWKKLHERLEKEWQETFQTNLDRA
ncbi:hypothetical protein [Mycobacteroides abscessus]|uniref:hypothetical protein n=1 Tax=Mycobacteroides abscessus TaxID=36809 RepID=UPI00160148B0|nr:hypothetical protein [Mycobacteroides abscessus]